MTLVCEREYYKGFSSESDSEFYLTYVIAFDKNAITIDDMNKGYINTSTYSNYSSKPPAYYTNLQKTIVPLILEQKIIIIKELNDFFVNTSIGYIYK